MALEPMFIERLIVEGNERRRQATKGPEQSGDHVDDEAEPRLLRERQAVLGLTLYVSKRISRHQKLRVQVVAAERRKGKVTDSVRGIEGATHQLAADPDISRPMHDVCESRVGSGLEPRQPAFLDELIAEAPE